MVISIAFTSFEVIVFNSRYDVFSKSNVSTYFKAFITIISAIFGIEFSGIPIIHYTVCISVIGGFQIGQCRHIVVVSIYAPATRLRSFSSFVCQTCYPTAVIKTHIVICIAIHIFSRQFQVFNNRNSNTYVVNFAFVSVIHVVVRSISINYANFTSYVNDIQTVIIFISSNISSAFSFTYIASKFYFFTIGNFQSIKFIIKNVTGMKFEVLTTSIKLYAADRTGYISPVQFYIIIFTVIIGIILFIL